jgi:uncharacterized protein
MTSTQASLAPAPIRPTRRIEVIDILRGFAVLGMLTVNMLSFSGYAHVSLQEMDIAHRLVTLFIRLAAEAKFYPLFSFLFGWGVAVQMARAAEREEPFVPLYVRRLTILLLIGLVHAVLIWEGDILVTYALLGLPLLLFRRRSDKIILLTAVACLLIPVLLSAPGSAASIRDWHTGAVAPLRQAVMEGYRGNVYAEGSYLAVAVHRLKALGFSYSNSIYWAPHIFGMFLLGFYAGRRRILHRIVDHLVLFRWAIWVAPVAGLPLTLVFVGVSRYPDLLPAAYRDLATRGARMVGGSALCLFYISGFILLTQQKRWMRRLSPLASVGRTALSNYLLQSVICTLFFYGYGLGLYGQLGPAITIFLTLLLFRVQVSLSRWWLERHQFGPAEWLWRSLTYGEFQPWEAEPRAVVTRVGSSTEMAEKDSALFNGVVLVMQRLAFIAAVTFAIVYFCAVGLRLGANSRLRIDQQPYGVRDVAQPAFEETIHFFEGLSRGELGLVAPGVSGRDWESATKVLRDAYVHSARLLIVAVGAAAVIGIGAGTIAAAWRHSGMVLTMLTLTVVGVSIPSFFLALLIQIGSIEFYQRTGIRVAFFGPHPGGGNSLLPQMALPALVLAARPLAHISRVTFVSLSEVLDRDFVRTARAKGVRELLVFWRHVLRNAGVSILTAMGVSLRFALGSLPVAEIFFDWPGLGVTMLNGIFQRETNVVTGAALGLGVTFLLINMSLDLIYRIIDPRLRGQNNGGAP